MKLFTTMFLLATVILFPINTAFSKFLPPRDSDPDTSNASYSSITKRTLKDQLPDTSYLWAYLVFTYLFTGLTIYFIRAQTLRIIKVRQEYLGNQETVTDRTIKCVKPLPFSWKIIPTLQVLTKARLSGIPPELRDEETLKETIEKLNIGKVESVTICRDWKILDNLMDKRTQTLRKLEEAWAVHIGPKNTIHIAPLSSVRKSLPNSLQ